MKIGRKIVGWLALAGFRFAVGMFGVATLMALVGAAEGLPIWRSAAAGLVIAMLGWMFDAEEAGK
jgi:hypothetical protein